MNKSLLCIVGFICAMAQGQDYVKIAKDLQQKHQDKAAAIVRSGTVYEFEKDAKTFAKVTVEKNEKILSLRYNSAIYQTEVYDQNSRVEKFYAESNLKQRAPDGYKICGTYTHDGLFFDDSKFCTQELKLKEIGEVWDVTSIKKIQDAKYLTTIFFQEKFPLLEKKITFAIPQEIEVEIKEFHLTEFAVTRSEKTDGTTKIIEYTAKNLQGLEDETYERGIQFNHPHLLVLVKSVTVAGKKTNILSSSQDLYTWYSSLTKQLKPNHQVFKSTVTELIKDKKTDEEKIKSIYYWVQDNIRYIAFEDGIAGFKPDEAHNVFEKRYGDCKGMANLIKEMLKAAGYDARLTWIGTKRIMYDQTIPTLAANNHMICTVILGQKKYYLDPTEKYMPFGENADRIQGRSVMIENGDKFIMEKILESDKNRNADLRNLTATISGESLKGKYKIDLKGETKKNFLYSYHYTKTDMKDEFMSEFISNGNKNVNIANLKLPNLEERSGPLSLECELVFSGAVSAFNNEYYVDIDPTKSFKNWTIKDTRQSDIDFGEKIQRKTSIELQIPKGYKVAHLPESVKVSDAEFSFAIHYALSNDKIIYTKELSIHEGIIKKKSFSRWNAAVEQLAKAYENQIVLKK